MPLPTAFAPPGQVLRSPGNGPLLRSGTSIIEPDIDDPVDNALQAALSAYRADTDHEHVSSLLELARDALGRERKR